MKIFQSAREAGRAFPHSVLTLGKFDGVHRGHQRVLRAAVERARALKTGCLAAAFDPAPDEFLRLYCYRPLLSLAERLEVMARLGVDAAVILPFTKTFASLSPREFARDVVAERLRPVDVIVGRDFCFGRERSGRLDDLIALGREFGFLVHSVPVAIFPGGKITAEAIRERLNDGDRGGAEQLLGYSW